MFFLEVTCGDKKAYSTGSEFGDKLETYKSDDVSVSYLKGSLFAIKSPLFGRLLVGDFCSRSFEKKLAEFEDEFNAGKDIFARLKETFFNLVMVEISKKRITMIHKSSCIWPLYYRTEKDRFICSSHIGALKTIGLDLKPERDSYPEFCVYRYVLPPRSLYRGLGKLRKGQMISIDVESGNIKATQAWYTKSEKHTGSNDPLERFDGIDNELLSSIQNTNQTTKKRGILLSGGIDSALLAAICKKRDLEYDSFSSSFAFINKDDREDEYALSVAKHLGLNHTIVSSTPEQYLTDLVWSIYVAEEPVHHLQSVMLYRLFKEASRSNYNLFLCGEGADGLFGNDAHMKFYRHRARINLARRAGMHWLFKAAYRMLGLKNERLDYFAHDFGDRTDTDNHILWTLGRYGDPEIVRRYFKNSLKDTYE